MPVKYGIIGCGAIAQRRHIPECVVNPESKLVALADPVKERVDELATKYGAKGYTDYNQMLKNGQAFMGVTGDLGVHKADLLRWLLGQEFTEVGGILATLDKRDPEGKLIDLDDNAYLTLKTSGGIVGSMILSWTNYGAEENYTVLYCQKGVLSLGTDPTWGVIVDFRNGERELHKVGEMSTNVKQVASGIIDSFTKSIATNVPPEIDGMEGYRSLDVILTAMDAAKVGKAMKVG